MNAIQRFVPVGFNLSVTDAGQDEGLQNYYQVGKKENNTKLLYVHFCDFLKYIAERFYIFNC